MAIKYFFRGPPPEALIQPWALLFPIIAGLLHSLTTDTFMLPQLAWYFHLLLGLIPEPAPVPKRSRAGWAWIGARAVALTGALALGILVGTSSYFSPEKLPSAETVRSILREVPVVKLLFYEKQQHAIKDSEKPLSGDFSPTGGLTRVIPDSKPVENFGDLIVNIENYKGSPVNWAIMAVLDNSKSMTEQAHLGGATRQEMAMAAIASLAREMPPGSKLGLRTFVLDVLAKSKSKEIPLRISRSVLNWTETPISILPDLMREITFKGHNNICAGVLRSLRTDFRSVPELKARIAIITDGRSDCSFGEIFKRIESEKKHNLKLDVIALDMPRQAKAVYSKLAAESGGVFVSLIDPTETEVFSEYLAALRETKPKHLQAVTESRKYDIMPGQQSRLAPGAYTMILPEIEGMEVSDRTINDIKVVVGRTTILNLSVTDGRIVVRE